MSELVQHLARLSGLHLPEEDVEPLARALEAHAELVRPLLELDLASIQSALDLDQPWD
jgi:Asp-tRNA(Asn)/Glu-tRNA(Gln) amidotransferase C subunit